MMADVVEFNFDGLIGPTHNYAGLSPGNFASQHHGGQISFPKAAAKQGLAKMRTLLELGVPQGFLPPPVRPRLSTLRQLGFIGSDREVLAAAGRDAPDLLGAVYSASTMWAANAATISPSPDTGDGRLHLTPANLITSLHRAIETNETSRTLQRIFSGDLFQHHDPLPASRDLADEGAANHTRLCRTMDTHGVELFVDGSDLGIESDALRLPARQTRRANQAIARRHGLSLDRIVFARQSSAAINAGAFHNDVISVGHRDRFLVHEQAFEQQTSVIHRLRETCGDWLHIHEVRRDRMDLSSAVESYLFNSQIVTADDHRLVLVAPRQCEKIKSVRDEIESMIQKRFVDTVCFVDVDQSMANGGGPACLRLRVAMTNEQASQIDQRFILSRRRIDWLDAWVDRHYRNQIAPPDLIDVELLNESANAVEELWSTLPGG